MLKYIKHHLETISGIEIYPIISFIIFFTFFTALIIYVVRMKKNTIEELSNIPLQSNQTNNETD